MCRLTLESGHPSILRLAALDTGHAEGRAGSDHTSAGTISEIYRRGFAGAISARIPCELTPKGDQHE